MPQNIEYSYREAMKLDNQLCFPLYAAARKVTALYTPWLKELGLTYTQYVAFLVLWEHNEITVGELCERLMLDNGTVSPMLKKMEQAGWVRRSRAVHDERIVQVALTEQGRALQKKAQDVPLHVASCFPLSEDKGRELYELLYDLLDNLDDIQQPKAEQY